MLEDTVECAWGQVVARLAGDGDPLCFGWMLELAMAPANPDKKPAIDIEWPQHLSHLHVTEPGIVVRFSLIPARESAAGRQEG